MKKKKNIAPTDAKTFSSVENPQNAKAGQDNAPEQVPTPIIDTPQILTNTATPYPPKSETKPTISKESGFEKIVEFEQGKASYLVKVKEFINGKYALTAKTGKVNLVLDEQGNWQIGETKGTPMVFTDPTEARTALIQHYPKLQFLLWD